MDQNEMIDLYYKARLEHAQLMYMRDNFIIEEDNIASKVFLGSNAKTREERRACVDADESVYAARLRRAEVVAATSKAYAEVERLRLKLGLLATAKSVILKDQEVNLEY